MDTNIIISLMRDDGEYIARALERADTELACSEMVRLEVYGFRNLLLSEKVRLQRFFDECVAVPITEKVIDRAIDLRQQRAIKSPDAIIAATALLARQPLWTANVKDFSWIPELEWHNPIGRSI